VDDHFLQYFPHSLEPLSIIYATKKHLISPQLLCHLLQRVLHIS
jgi:hypothetical protein